LAIRKLAASLAAFASTSRAAISSNKSKYGKSRN
jgi:hypothetical protein